MISPCEALILAAEHIRGSLGGDYLPVPDLLLEDPAGLFCSVRRADHVAITGGPGPVFVFTENGRVLEISLMRLTRHLLAAGSQAGADQSVLSAPDFTKARDRILWATVLSGVITSQLGSAQ